MLCFFHNSQYAYNTVFTDKYLLFKANKSLQVSYFFHSYHVVPIRLWHNSLYKFLVNARWLEGVNLETDFKFYQIQIKKEEK